MIEPKSEYTKCVRNSEKVSWRMDDVLAEGQNLDFSRTFLPEALAQTERVTWLSRAEKHILNHITSNAYLNLFAFAEDYVISMALDTAKIADSEALDTDRTRALMRFADEEAKHQQIFLRFCRAFARGFKHECGVLGSPTQVTKFILTKHPIAVLLLTLHLELMTQHHYTEAIRDDSEIDPLFVSLLKHHWLEEAQHVAIDLLEIEKLGQQSSQEEKETALNDYLELVGAFNGLLGQQADMDVDTLTRASGRALTDTERQLLAAEQRRTYARMFMSCGMLHKKFLNVCSQLSATAPVRVQEWARTNLPEGATLPV